MKLLPILALLLISQLSHSQSDSLTAITRIQKFQRELNEEYQNRKTSPLDAADLKKFKSHSFFPIDLRYCVSATLTAAPGSAFFEMPTTTLQKQWYRIYGYLSFSIDGKSFQLPVYQSKQLMAIQEYTDYLFLPFTDKTNGVTSYSGGRYIGLRFPKEGNEIIIDFNEAYNPYCAYSGRFSCPIVPKENNLDVEVRAGVMYRK